jgi:hypothetical protein
MCTIFFSLSYLAYLQAFDHRNFVKKFFSIADFLQIKYENISVDVQISIFVELRDPIMTVHAKHEIKNLMTLILYN